MALYNLDNLRARALGSPSDSSRDADLVAFGTQADAQIADELYVAASESGKLQALPAVDVANGQIGGVAAPQSLKDAATDRATALFFFQERQVEIAKTYLDNSKAAVAGYVARLHYDRQLRSANV